jgi:hypothetical protein
MSSRTGTSSFRIVQRAARREQSQAEQATAYLVFFFNFPEDLQAVLYGLCCLLREVIHFLSAHPEEGFPTEFVETSQTFPATQSPTPTTVSTMRPIWRGGMRRKFFSR